MTTRTIQDLATAAMRKAGMIDINKQPTAAELAMATRIYEEKYAELNFRDLVYWTASAIPLEAFGAMVRMVAAELCPPLGKEIPTEQDEDGKVMAIDKIGMRMLRRHLARDATGLPVKAQYF